MADPSVGWCGRPTPWSAAELPESPPVELLPDPAIERLLALYTSGGDQLTAEEDADASQSSSTSEEILSNQDLTLDKAVIARDLLGESEPPAEPRRTSPSRWEAPAPLLAAPPSPPTPRPLDSEWPWSECASLMSLAAGAPMATLSPRPDDSDVWRKAVQLGAAHQAVLPAGPCLTARRRVRPAPMRPTQDRLLWDPSRLSESEVERYQQRLRPAASCTPATGTTAGDVPLPDDEQALFQLQQCGHDVEEALRRVRPPVTSERRRLSTWSDSECDLFEEGLLLYGKNFLTIQRQKVRTRSVGEIVHFYYLWKKTERHGRFLRRSQLDKRKYGPDPGTSQLHTVRSDTSLQIRMAAAEPWSDWLGAALSETSDARHSGLLAACPHLMLP